MDSFACVELPEQLYLLSHLSSILCLSVSRLCHLARCLLERCHKRLSSYQRSNSDRALLLLRLLTPRPFPSPSFQTLLAPHPLPHQLVRHYAFSRAP